ncbi:MAG: M20/M25/M40 family metallo-hydrolase [Candidatus Cloacimonetes bacterium]|nr:M20/M25/M40 family metallo-hydrolase [Candidatus Cloacimonadota bacterium]
MEKSLIDYFLTLVQIDSESKNELPLAQKLKSDLKKLGAKVRFDHAAEKTGGTTGNLIASFSGEKTTPPILLCAHLDTVVPGRGIKPVVDGDLIKSDGTTILGADDKSGIVQIIWAIKELIENNENYPSIEILFTVSEEIGLCGAKNCDFSMLKAKECLTFDSHDVGTIMNGAPSQNNLRFKVHGKKAHAGVEPEKGLNAIRIASEAIAAIPLGRIDKETTCNIGIISGGAATNIVPDLVEIKGEARSHNEEKLTKLSNDISDIFRDVVTKHKVNGTQAKVDIEIDKSYSTFYIDPEDPLILLARQASQNLKFPDSVYKGGGGSDANILNLHGIKTIVIGTGMKDVHTLQENISITDLKNGVLWVKEFLRLYAERKN